MQNSGRKLATASGKTLDYSDMTVETNDDRSTGMKLTDITWDMVRMVSIKDLTLRITTDLGVNSFTFQTPDELSQALLILSLSGTRKVEDIDEARFNPARFLSCYGRKPAMKKMIAG